MSGVAYFVKLHSIQPEWLIMYLLKESDMTSQDLVALREISEDYLTVLLQFDVQLNIAVRFPHACQVKDMIYRIKKNTNNVNNKINNEFNTHLNQEE